MSFETYTKKTRINASAKKLFQWHTHREALLRLTPPWTPVKIIQRKGTGVEDGAEVTFSVRIAGVPITWKAEHFDCRENRMFKDRQLKGPFAFWEHTHRFTAQGPMSAVMEDDIRFRLPLGPLGRLFSGYAKKELERMFTYRHRVLKHDLEQNFDETGPRRILISGGGGSIGNVLIPYLRTCGHEVVRLVRKKGRLNQDEIFWDPYRDILDLTGEKKFDAVINLNGVDISRGRWTDKQKKKILVSRTRSTGVLAREISRLKDKPDVFISSSAIGYYGNRGEQTLTEADDSGDCFISDVCRQWENASKSAEEAGIRTVVMRTGIVLTPAAGALQRMLPPFRLGLGVRIAGGDQYMSWISVDDMVSAILFLINSSGVSGPVNMTAPNPVVNAAFSDTLASVWGKKVYFAMPAAVVRMIWGQMGEETLLMSARVMPRQLLAHGFSFRHETLLPAMKDLLGR